MPDLTRYAHFMGRSVIVSTARTPFGRLGGALAGYEATQLGGIVIRAALERAGIEDSEVGYAVMGQVLQGGAGQAPSRQATVAAGLPIDLPSDTINKVCASSIRAIEIADLMVRAGEHDVVVAGGMESMTNTPYALKKARFGYRLGDGTLIDLTVHDGLTSSFDQQHMIQQASFVSRELGIAREDQDRWALRSHERAVNAIDHHLFDPEIVPVDGVAVDEGPRRDTSYEKLAKLRPVFDPTGTTTAGNAPGINDGAAGSRGHERGVRCTRGLEVLATILSQAYVADEFAYLARTPANAGKQALQKAGKSIDDVERVELNEAFSSVVLNSRRDARRRSRSRQRERRGRRVGTSDRRIRRPHRRDARAGAAPQRRRCGAGRHLLRRRPGRRTTDRGLTPSG